MMGLVRFVPALPWANAEVFALGVFGAYRHWVLE